MNFKFLFIQTKCLSFLSLLSCMTLLIFLFAGCQTDSESNSDGSSTGNHSDSAEKVQVSFGFSMTSSQNQVTSSTPTKSSLAEKSTTSLKWNEIFKGQLLATNTTTSATESFDWSISLDNETWKIKSNRTINLVPANYQFSLLLTRGDQQYAGTTAGNVDIIDGTNDVALTIRPIIGDVLTNVSFVPGLANFQFKYNTDELSRFIAPKIGISIDGGEENIFAINKDTGMSEAYQNIPVGQRNIQLKFYDGNVQKGKSMSAQEDKLVVAGKNIPMDLVSLHGETSFSINADTGDATFQFNIPSEVIDEVEVIENLESIFSVATAHVNHEVALTLNASGDDYTASVTLSGFRYGLATISLTFNDLAKPSKELLGTCTYDVTLDVNTNINSCDLSLRRRAVVGGNLYSSLGINVLSQNGWPVQNAVIYANDGSTDVQVGITGTGTFGTKGFLNIFLKKGTYTIRAERGSQSGQKDITLDALDIENIAIHLATNLNYLTSCKAILDAGQSVGDGVYSIDPDGSGPSPVFDVYCDMTTDGGGWIVIQRRQDGSVNFYLNWADYKAGFGSLNGEFWIGNDYLSLLTNTVTTALRVELHSKYGRQGYAKYSTFQVASEDHLYRSTIRGYTGTSGDSLTQHNNQAFSTKDRDNDRASYTSCAVDYRGAWWYHRCYDSSLNGVYGADNNKSIQWNSFSSIVSFSEMKIR